MKITITATHISYGGGLTHLNKMIEWFAKLAPECDFVVIGHTGQNRMFIAPPANTRYQFHRLPSLGLPARIFWERFFLPRVINRTECDLLFEPGSNGKFRVDCPTVSLLHNIAPFSDENINEESAYQRFRNRWLGRMALASMRSSSAIIFLSEYCREFFAELVDLSQKQVAIIYHGKPDRAAPARNANLRGKHKIPKEYLLYVSHIYRYKKMYETVQGYLSAIDKDPTLPPLLIVGETYDYPYRDSITELASHSAYADRVIFLGAVENDYLQYLYANCRVFLFSSILETCSVILIEALSHGCVMGCSNKSVVPEICQDGAVYFDPYDPQSIADTILRLHKDSNLRERMSKNARRRSEDFSWQMAARQTLQLFEATMKRDIVLTKLTDDKNSRAAKSDSAIKI